MSRRTLTAAAVVMLMFTAGCSVFEGVVYRPDINQGNYLTAADVAKIHTGMTKQQVVCTLGTSMMKDPFGSNIWYYIFRRELGHRSVTQQTLTLTFNSSDILTRSTITDSGRSQQTANRRDVGTTLGIPCCYSGRK